MTQQKIGVRLVIEGHVQGVYFRKFTKEIATQLALTGWVRNVSDGSVEVQVWGPVEKIEQLMALLKKGPAGALVQKIGKEFLTWEEHPKFEVR